MSSGERGGESAKGAYVADLTPDTSVTSAFLVIHKEVKQRKEGGGAYLDLLLGDRTGQIKAVMWDNVEAVADSFETDDFLKVRGNVSTYRDKPQLKLDRIRRLEEREVELADYLPTTTADVEAMWRELEGRITSLTNPHLKALLEAIFGDPEIAAQFRKAPAAKVLHHAYLGGLLEHVTSLSRLAEMAAAHYNFIDRDLLLTGVLLHDLGKIGELRYERSFSYSTPGQLLGHMVMVLRTLHQKLAGLPHFPPPLAVMVEHLIISHHGKYEFGSPKLPMFPEALLLHQLDDMDSKMQSMITQLREEAPGANREWTSYNRSLERPLLRREQYWSGAEGAAAGQAGQP